ncbi:MULTISPECIES: dihydrolipoamide acetyltransferase family protein [Cohnella]|uniref:dihydrolipoamide acetyltransferase family protein n=1 Tax=Cohnella TaxID=329857 RepID=UPI0009BAE894|nr:MULTISPECIES: dihydrolipoamide acetyltransferase family protein [Cohnella]MBN2984403.1 2-oxo acid dehydrogenase subunit E2 [Cohnella algarum]
MAKKIAEIIMPQLAESLVSATIDRWLKEPGDRVEMYEPLCEIQTDKVNAELPATIAGVLVKKLVGEGEEVAVGSPIGLIETEADSAAEADGVPERAEGSAAPSVPAAPASARPGAAIPAPAAAFDPGAPMRGRYSPAVQRLAAEHGLDLSRVNGTGLGGRITRKDVLQAVQTGGFAASPAPSAGRPAPEPSAAPARPSRPEPAADAARMPTVEVEGKVGPGREYYIDVTPIRKTIAKNMRQSVSEIPHAWTMVEVDITHLVELRNLLKDDFREQEGINLTYMPFLIKAVVGALKEFPIMNSVWADDKIIVKRDINISLAVGTEDSVLTPVIRNADQKNIVGLAHEIHDLARRTRENKLKLADLQGGTFTVNNTGTFGSVQSVPIINYPQAAILTFETIVKRPVVLNDMIGIRSMVNLCLSFDHRILDGVICGKFHQRVKANLESYDKNTKLY